MAPLEPATDTLSTKSKKRKVRSEGDSQHITSERKPKKTKKNFDETNNEVKVKGDTPLQPTADSLLAKSKKRDTRREGDPHSNEPEKKAKKTKKIPDETDDEVKVLEGEGGRPVKERKRKQAADASGLEVVAKSSKKKTYKENLASPEPIAPSRDAEGESHEKEGKSRKRKRDVGVVEGETNCIKKVEKKKKRSKDNEEAGLLSTTTPPDKPEKSEKQKGRNKTGFPDPNDDDSLPDQSKKCLAYAFLQFHRPSMWKFKKARQNWLIRNIWSSGMVPETYLPLAAAYLAKVQGGVRENLTHVCHLNLQPFGTDDQGTEPTETDGGNTASPSTTPHPPSVGDSTKKLRAQALLDVLSSSQESS